MVVYSIIPYKTPWNLLPFLTGLILLAGMGAAFLLRWFRRPLLRGGVVVLLCMGVAHLGLQSYRASFVYYADPKNPYVYAHTSEDFLNLIHSVEEISALHPEKKDMLIKVFTNTYDTWPLPWYLRDFSRVGYWHTKSDAEAVDIENIPLIITSPDMLESQPSAQFVDNYVTEYYGLRPEVLLAIHIRRDLWDKFMKHTK